MNEAVYDTIGKTHDVTRRADPAITKKIIDDYESDCGDYLYMAAEKISAE